MEQQSWSKVIHALLAQPQLKQNFAIVANQRRKVTVWPKHDDIFRAFTLCKLDKVKVVILGQDPYPTSGTADGLAFSTKDRKTPTSLNYIFQEIKRTYPNSIFETNSLEWWAKQGVLLLNTSLTVQEDKPNSHKIYWKLFIMAIVKALKQSDKRIVWMLWGNEAKSYLPLLHENSDQCKLEACHPAAEAYGSAEFVGCNHFKHANEYLEAVGRGCIDWNTHSYIPYPTDWND